MIDDDTGSHASELSLEERGDVTNIDELVKDYKSNRKRGMLGWFKLRVSSPIPSGVKLIFLWQVKKRWIKDFNWCLNIHASFGK